MKYKLLSLVCIATTLFCGENGEARDLENQSREIGKQMTNLLDELKK